MKIWNRDGRQLGLFGLIALAIILSILSIVARSGKDGAEERNLRYVWSLADDIPLPPDSFIGAGVGGSALGFAPKLRHISASFAVGVLTYYEDGLESQGWELSDKEVADDGAWTAGWTKDERIVRLTFGPRLLGSKPELRLEQCPPLTPGNCGPGTLNPMPTPKRR